MHASALQEATMSENTAHNKGSPMGSADKGSPVGTTNKGSPEGRGSPAGVVDRDRPVGVAAQWALMKMVAWQARATIL